MKNTLQGKTPKTDFERGRTYSVVLIAMTIALSVISLMFTKSGTTESMALTISALLCAIAAVVVVVKFCRCPYCGKRVITGVLVVETCPKCRRSLTTGDKVRKRKKYAKIPPERLPERYSSRKK